MADLNDFNKPTVADLRVDVQDTLRGHAARAVTLNPGTATNRPVGAKLAELISNVFTLKNWNGTAYDTWLTISNFWRGVLDDTTASDAQTSLGGTTVGKAVFTAVSETAAKAAIKAGRAGYVDVSSGASLTLTNAQQNLAFSSSTASGELSRVNGTGVVTINDGVVALEMSGCILLQNNDTVAHEFEIAHFYNGSNIYPHGNIKLAAGTRILTPINGVIFLGYGSATTIAFRVRVPTSPAINTCYARFAQNTNFSGWWD